MKIGDIEIYFWERTSINSIPSYLMGNGDIARLRKCFEQCYFSTGTESPEDITSDDFYLWMTNDKALHDFLELRLCEFAIPLRDSSKIVTLLYSFMPSEWCYWPKNERMREFMLPALYEFYCYQLDECYRILTRHYDFDEIIMMEGRATVRLEPREDLIPEGWKRESYWPTPKRKHEPALIEIEP